MISEMKVQSELGWNIAKEIAEKLNSTKYMSTQSTAFALLSISNYIKHQHQVEQISFKLKGPNPKTIVTNKCIWKDTKQKDSPYHLSLQNNMTTPLFLTVTQQGIPTTLDTLNESLGMQLSAHYYIREGVSILPDSIKQGTDFYIEIKVRNLSEKDYKHLSLSYMVPSGWEIYNSAMTTIPWKNQVNFEEVRDDRINLFYHLKKESSKTFRIYLNASYLGKFYMPAIQTEDMYHHDIRARIHGKWINVIND